MRNTVVTLIGMAMTMVFLIGLILMIAIAWKINQNSKIVPNQNNIENELIIEEFRKRNNERLQSYRE